MTSKDSQAFSSRHFLFPDATLPLQQANPTITPLRPGRHRPQPSTSSLSSFASSSNSSMSSYESEGDAWEDARSSLGAPPHRRNESWESRASSFTSTSSAGFALQSGKEDELEDLGREAVELLERLEAESRRRRSNDASALAQDLYGVASSSPPCRKRNLLTHTLVSCQSTATLRPPAPCDPFLDSSLLPLSFHSTPFSSIDIDGLLLAYETEAHHHSIVLAKLATPPSRSLHRTPSNLRRALSSLPYDELFPHRPAAPFPTIPRPKPGFSPSRALFPPSSPTFLRSCSSTRRRRSLASSSSGSGRSQGSSRWSVTSGSTAPTILEEEERWFPTSKRDSRASERSLRLSMVEEPAREEVEWEEIFETHDVADVFPRWGPSEGRKEERMQSVVEEKAVQKAVVAKRQPSGLRRALSSRFGQAKSEVVRPVPQDLGTVTSTTLLGRSEGGS